ncbi:Glutamate receptor ionotropic, kainate 4, variant 2 [Dermatophagoides farinae]|uniref:Glutamate receptor ionotropic, kainate 4, variant 2 n=1 Tax=Dermatophagoides farinae TaxID=6954 RepID=A0A922I6U3_DERFA|nr:Glutamate receptor ionotropic, kainate 4, variant 2 [Dermatophagoides farinae]
MKNTGKKSLNHHHHRANIFYIAIRLLLKQPYQQLRWMKKLEKFCLIIWCMAIIVLHILYGTFLFSTLTIPTKMVIDTVDKLAEECGQNKIIILTQLNSANGKILLESYRRLYDYTENSDDDELALNLLIRQMNYSPKAKQYAVISYRKTLQYYQNGGDEKQLYYIPPNHSGSSISMTWISFPFRNDFKYLQSFNKLLSLYKSSGLIKHWFEREKMKANKFRSLMINTNKKQQYNVPRHYDYHDHKDDSVYAIIRTSSTNLQMLFQMYLTFNTISILMCIICIHEKWDNRKKNDFFHNAIIMRLNLEAKTLIVGYNNDLPYTSIMIQSLNNDRLFGIDTSVIRTIAEYFNFTIKFIDCNNIYGYRLSNGSFNGMIGLLETEQIDLGIGGVMMNYERNLVTNHLYTHLIDYVTFMTSTAKQSSINYYSLLKPFTNQVWMMILAIFFLFYMMKQIRSNLIVKYQRYFNDYHNNNIIWISLGLFFRQPYHPLRSTHLSFKIMMSFWILSVLILSTMYGVFLSSDLAIANHYIHTIQHLADECHSQNIIPLIQANTSAIKTFSMSKRKDFQMIWQKTQQISDTEEGIQMIIEQNLNGKKFSLITTRYSLQYYQCHYGKNLLYLPPLQFESSFYPFLVSIPVRKSFEHFQSFDILIFYLQSSGLVQKWLRDELSNRQSSKEMAKISKQNNQFIDDAVEQISLHQYTYEEFKLIFLLHIWCITICMAIFIIEFSLSIRIIISNLINKR